MQRSPSAGDCLKVSSRAIVPAVFGDSDQPRGNIKGSKRFGNGDFRDINCVMRLILYVMWSTFITTQSVMG
jgi:hypothetical protein